MSLTDLAPDDSGEHAALDVPDPAIFGPPAVFYLDRRNPAERAAGWLVVVLVTVVLWLLLGLALLVLF